MPLPKLSIQVLEAFEAVARSGSIQTAAGELGASISTVSGHIAKLEKALGTTLLDRSARPLVLTREGGRVLRHLSGGLHHLRRATSEIAVGGLLSAHSLRIGVVEDFENSLTPNLAVALAGRMPHASLSLSNILSHDAPLLLQGGKLDIAIAAEPTERPEGIVFEELLRDPFLLVMPTKCDLEPDVLLVEQPALPFLRFSPHHLIGKQIDAHLARSRITLPKRLTFDSVQSIMAVVANGDGWSIITPLGYARAQRYAAEVTLRSLPIPSFARRLSIMARTDFDMDGMAAIALLVRDSIKQTTIDPLMASHPWLEGAFTLLPAPTVGRPQTA